MSIASLPPVARRMGRWWKPAQRLIYVAAVLVLVHAVTVTIHLVHLRAILVGAYVALLPLVAVELIRLDRWARARSDRLPRNVFALISVPVASAMLFLAFFLIGHHEH